MKAASLGEDHLGDAEQEETPLMVHLLLDLGSRVTNNSHL